MVYIVIQVLPRGHIDFAKEDAEKQVQNVYSSPALKCLRGGVLVRGICYAVCWAGAGNRHGVGKGCAEEILAILDAPKKFQANRRKSMFNWVYPVHIMIRLLNFLSDMFLTYIYIYTLIYILFAVFDYAFRLPRTTVAVTARANFIL